MKTTVAPYTTSALCLRIVCTNGTTIRVTRYPYNLTMSNGQVYLTGSGFDFTGYESTSGFSPSAIDLEGILGFAGVTRDQVASGVFDGARAYLFACNFLSPVEDYEPIVASFLGKATLTDNGYRFEEMALVDALNKSFGSVDAWLSDFKGVGAMRGVGWAVLYQDPATGWLSMSRTRRNALSGLT